MLSSNVFNDMIKHFETRYGGSGMDSNTQSIWWSKLKNLDDKDFHKSMIDLCGCRKWPYGYNDVIIYIRDNLAGKKEASKPRERFRVDPNTPEQKFHRRLIKACTSLKKRPDWLQRYFRILVKYYKEGVYQYSKRVNDPEFTKWLDENGQSILKQQADFKTANRDQEPKQVLGTW